MITCRAHRCENRLTLRDGESERAEMEVKLFTTPEKLSNPFLRHHRRHSQFLTLHMVRSEMFFFAMPCFSIIYHYTVDQRMCKLELKYMVFSSQLSSVQY